MAIFGTNNRCSVLEGVDIEADMSYAGIEGCAKALLEAKENDHALFVGVMTNDIQSVLTEDVEQREAINEASVKGIWSSIVRIFEKLVAKVKGIIASATAKFVQVVSDGEKLFKQYGKKLDKDLAGCKTKIREFDTAKYSEMSRINLSGVYGGIEDGDDAETAISGAFTQSYVSGLKNGSADKAFDACFKPEAEISVTKDMINGWVKDQLTKSFLNDVIKANKATESSCAQLLATAKKKEKEAAKNNAKAASKNTSDETKKDMDNAEKVAGTAVQTASALQTAVITFTAARLNAAKKAVIQARKVFMAAVAYKAKASDKAEAKETAKNEGFEFVEESVNYAGLYEVLGEASYIEAALIAESEMELALS